MGRNRVTERSPLIWEAHIFVSTESQKEPTVIECVLVSGNWEIIHFINSFKLDFKILLLEKEGLLRDRISKISKYKSLSFWDRLNLLFLDPIVMWFPFPSQQKKEKKKIKRKGGSKYPDFQEKNSYQIPN